MPSRRRGGSGRWMAHTELGGRTATFTWSRKRKRPLRQIKKARPRPLSVEQLESRLMPAVNINVLSVPSTGGEGQTVALHADASTDVSGASLTYNWAFG